jgi:hypothetical protein
MFGKDADELAGIDYQRAAGVGILHLARNIASRRIWRDTDGRLVFQPAQIIFHYGLRKTFRGPDAGNVELPKRRQTILATVNAVNVFVATGRTVHFLFPIANCRFPKSPLLSPLVPGQAIATSDEEQSAIGNWKLAMLLHHPGIAAVD